MLHTSNAAFEAFNWAPWLILTAIAVVSFAADCVLARFPAFPLSRFRSEIWLGVLLGVVAYSVYWVHWLQAPGPALVIFSNDGPLGVMNSAYMREAAATGPGTALWNDNYWLGQASGEVPCSVSYMILWLISGAPAGRWKLLAMAAAVMVGMFIAWLEHRRHRPREVCPECGQARLLGKMNDTVTGGRVCDGCFQARLWGPNFKQKVTK